jgi:outer membrane protein TolC
VKAAEQGYADLQNQYSAGTAKSVDVLSALQDLSSARLDLTSLTLDYEVALRGLEQFSGTFQDLRVRQLMERKR